MLIIDLIVNIILDYIKKTVYNVLTITTNIKCSVKSIEVPWWKKSLKLLNKILKKYIRQSSFLVNNYLWSNCLMIFTSWSRERGNLILRNYFPPTVFTKRFTVDVWHHRCLNKPWVLNMPEFSVYRGSEYTGVLYKFLVLNMSRFWIYHGSEYARFTQVFEYAWLYLNVPKFVWMASVLHLPIVISSLRYLILFIVLD